MATPLRSIVEHLFDAVEAKDEAEVLSLLDADAIFIDPHYPRPRMTGKEQIADGLRWVFSNMKTLSFSVTSYFEAEDGQSGAAEVATSHVLKTGMQLHVSQVFVFDIRDGLVTRLQAYEPYGPGGLGGLFLFVIRLIRRLQHRD